MRYTGDRVGGSNPFPLRQSRPQYQPAHGMALTIRPSGLSRDPNANDWSIHEDGAEIGRLYEDRQATQPENRWFWSITVLGPARFRVRTDSRATLEQAKADFQAAWVAFTASNSSVG